MRKNRVAKLGNRILAFALAVILALPASSITAYAENAVTVNQESDQTTGDSENTDNKADDEPDDSGDNSDDNENNADNSGSGSNNSNTGDQPDSSGSGSGDGENNSDNSGSGSGDDKNNSDNSGSGSNNSNTGDQPDNSGNGTDDAADESEDAANNSDNEENKSETSEEDQNHNLEYTDNEDGTHNKRCTDEDCEYAVDESHEFVDGECVCGAVEEEEAALFSTRQVTLGEAPSYEFSIDGKKIATDNAGGSKYKVVIFEPNVYESYTGMSAPGQSGTDSYKIFFALVEDDRFDVAWISAKSLGGSGYFGNDEFLGAYKAFLTASGWEESEIVGKQESCSKYVWYAEDGTIACPMIYIVDTDNEIVGSFIQLTNSSITEIKNDKNEDVCVAKEEALSAVQAVYDKAFPVQGGALKEALAAICDETMDPASNLELLGAGDAYEVRFDYVASKMTEHRYTDAFLYGSDSKETLFEGGDEIDHWGFYTDEEERGKKKSFSLNGQCKFNPEKGVFGGYDYYGVAIQDYLGLVSESEVIDATNFQYGEGNDSDYSRVAFLDENGDEIKKLELHEGESKLVRIALVRKDTGDYELLDNNEHEPNSSIDLKTDLLAENEYWSYKWSICNYDETEGDLATRYYYERDMSWYAKDKVKCVKNYDNDNIPPIKFAWTKEYILGLSNYITGTKETSDDEYYYVKYDVKSGEDGYVTMFGDHTAVLPVKVIAADGGYDNPESPAMYDSNITKEEEWQAIRDTMVSRENKYYGIIMERGEELPDGIEAYSDDIYDLNEERNGMLPEEGDYLHWTIGDRGSWGVLETTEYSEIEIGYYDDSYHMYIFPQQLTTTWYEEKLVSDEIDRLIGSGGELHAAYAKYRDNPNAENARTEALKAIFDWITSNVSGTVKGQKASVNARRTPMYHTAYSALFINNGYDSKRGSGTCQSFALLFTRLSREFGIPSKFIMGVDANAHTYNIAEFEDAWYYVDASAGLFKKNYNEFKRADEQSQFATYYFNKNYISKIKGYSREGSVMDVFDASGKCRYQATDFDDAAQFIADALDEEAAASEDGSVTSRYTVKLKKNVTLRNFGNSSHASWDSLEFQTQYKKYNDYVDIDLAGYTLTIPSSPAPGDELWANEATFGVNSISNGKITVGKNTKLVLEGADVDGTDYYSASDLTISGAGSLALRQNIELESSVNVNGITELIPQGGAVINADVNVVNLYFDGSFWVYNEEGELEKKLCEDKYATFNGDVVTQYLRNDGFNISYENLTVTKGAKFRQGCSVVINKNIRLNGRVYICNDTGLYVKPNDWTHCFDLLSYDNSSDSTTIKIVRTDGEKLTTERVFINGVIDASETSAKQRQETGFLPLAIVPVNESYVEEESGFKMNDTVGVFKNCTFYLSKLDANGEDNVAASRLTAQKLTVDNVGQLIEIPHSEGDMELYDEVLRIAGKFITVSTTSDDGDVVNELRRFTRWTDASNYIATLNNASANYLISLSEDIDSMGTFVLPASSSSVTFRSTKTVVEEDDPEQDPEPVSVNIAFKYVGDLNLNTNVSFENIDLVGQTYNKTNKIYTDGYRSVVKLNAKTLTLDHSSVSVASISGAKGSELTLRNGSQIDATKAISGITTLGLYDSVLETSDTIAVTGTTTLSTDQEDGIGAVLSAGKKINLVDLVSNGSENKISYGGNTSADILTVTGTVSGENASYRDLREMNYGPYVVVRTDAVTLCPATLSVINPATKKYVPKAFAELTDEEKANQTLVNSPKGTADWFVVEEAGDQYLPTYKSGTVIKYGLLNTNVVLLVSTDNGSQYEIESGYPTLAEAFKRIDALAVPSNYYKVEISDSADLATDASGATSSKQNPAFPSKLKKLTITSPELGTVLNYKDNLTIKSNVEIIDMTLKSASAAMINIGNFELALTNCEIKDSAGNIAAKTVKGGGIKGASVLTLDKTALQTTADISNVGKVIVTASPLKFGDFESNLLANTGMNIGVLDIGANQTVETRGTTTITDVIHNGGGTLVVPASVAKVTRKTATDEVGQVSKVTPMLTINGLVNNGANGPVTLKLTQKLTDSAKRVYYDVVDFSGTIDPEQGKMTEALKSAGVWIARAARVSADAVVLSGDNKAVADNGRIVKTAGYIAYRECDANAVLIYTDDNGVAVETPFAALSEAVTEINNIKTKRDYVIEVTDAATLPMSVEVGEKILYKAPAAFKMPTASCVDSLTIRPQRTEEDPDAGADIYFAGGITFTSNTVLEDINFVQMAKTGSNYDRAENITNYPAATSVSTGGYALTIKEEIAFNTPINLAGGSKGSLTFDDGAEIHTYSDGEATVGNTIFGTISGFSTLNVTEHLAVFKYRTKATAALTGGTLQVTNVLVYGSKNPKLTVWGNYTAANTSMASGDINIYDVYDEVAKKYLGAKAAFTNLTITGNDMGSAFPEDKITITADRDFNITGTLTCSTGRAKLATRERYNTDVAKRTPYLNISGTVLIDDYGNNSATSLGDRIEVEVLYSNECWDTEYIDAKGIGAETENDTDAVYLEGAPANTAMVLTTAKGTVDQFRLSPANISSGEDGRNVNRYDANNTDGYILKKASGKLYVYFGDEIQVAVVKNAGTDGKLKNVSSDSVLGYYPALADAVSAVDALKDKNTVYTFILMNNLGVKFGEQTVFTPISLNLPAYAKEVTVVSDASAELAPAKSVFCTNKITLKTKTTFRNINLNSVAIDRKKVVNGAALDIVAGGNDFTLTGVTFGDREVAGIANADKIGLNSVSGNSKNVLTLASDNLKINGNVSGFAEVILADSADTSVSGALTAAALSFRSDEKLNVKGAVTVTDINNVNGTLAYCKNASSRKTNLTIRGNVNNSNAAKRLKLVLSLAAPAGKVTTYESLSDILLAKVNNKVDIGTATKVLAYIDKAPLDAYTFTVKEDETKPDWCSAEYQDSSLVKANKCVYAADGDVRNSVVKLTYISGGTEHNVFCLDMAQAAKEIETINNPAIAYVITLPGNIDDTDVTADTAAVSAFKLPAAGRAAEVTITADSPVTLRYVGNISYAGKLNLKNIILDPVKITRIGIEPTDTAIASTLTVVKVNGVKETRQGLHLDNVTTVSDTLIRGEAAGCPVDSKGNPLGLITKITGTNKVTDIYINNSDLRIKEGVSSINDLHLDGTDLLTGKSSTLIGLYLENASDRSGANAHAWKMLGATSVENIYNNGNNTYLAATQTTKGIPNLTLKNRVEGEAVSVSLIKLSSTVLTPQPYDVYTGAGEGQSAIENANLLTAKLENADMFWPFVPEGSGDLSDWVMYKDKNGYVKAASEAQLKIRIEQYYDNGAEDYVTYAAGLADAVSVIDNMKDKEASYRVYISAENVRTGAVAADGMESYASFVTPGANAKHVTFIGNATSTGEGYSDDGAVDAVKVSYTGALAVKCNVSFENIIFDEGTFRNKVFTSNNILTLTTGNYDVSFDGQCGYVRDDTKNSKYGADALAADLLFGRFATGSFNASSDGITLEDRNAYCTGDVTMKNVIFVGNSSVKAGGKITLNGNTCVEDSSVGELKPGIGKALVVNNIYGNGSAALNLEYYYTKNKVYAKTASQLTINGLIESADAGTGLKVNLRPYLNMDGVNYTPASAADLQELKVTTVNYSGVTANQRLATLPKAAIEEIHVQYSDDGGSSWSALSADYKTRKHEKGLYISTLDSKVVVEGFTDDEYTAKVYESEFFNLTDAITDIDNIARTDRYYRITIDEAEQGYSSVVGLGMSRLPSKAKEVTIVGEAGQTVLVFFTGTRLTLGCNTVLEGVVLQGGASRVDTPINTAKQYDIVLGKYSLTEANAPAAVKARQTWSAFAEDISQTGIRKTISGSAGSTYTLKYTDAEILEDATAYLYTPASTISGVTNVNFIYETDVEENREENPVEEHSPAVITIGKTITGVTNLNVSGNHPAESAPYDYMDVKVNGAVSVTNASLAHGTLAGTNVTVSKVTTMNEATIKAGTSVIGDGKIKLADIVLESTGNILDGKQDKSGKSLMEITGSVSHTYEGTPDGGIAVGVRYCNDSNYAKLNEGFLMVTAQKVSPVWLTPMYDDGDDKYMGPGATLESKGYGLYKSGKSILFGKSGNQNAEVTLLYTENGEDNVTNFATFEDAVKEIDSLSLYVDPKAKVKTYIDYTISLNDDVEIGNAKGNGAYSALTLPAKAGTLTIAGGGHEIRFTGNVTLKANTVFDDLNLLPMKAVSGKGVPTKVNVSAGNYGLTFRDATMIDGSVESSATYGQSMLGTLSGTAKGAFILESGDLTLDAISAMGKVNVGTNARLDVNKNAAMTRLYLMNQKSDLGGDENLQNVSAVCVGGKLTASCVYIGVDGKGQVALEKPAGGTIVLNGETITVDGVKKLVSISPAEESADAVLNVIADGNSLPVGTLIMTDKCAAQNNDKIKLYLGDILEESEYSTYINGINVHSGKKV